MDINNTLCSISTSTTADVSIYFKHINNKETVCIEETKIFPSASTIKLFILATLLNEVKNNNLDLSTKISFTESMKCDGDGILKELSFDHKFTLEELATLMIILSDNSATNILIDFLTMKKINDFIKEISLTHTSLNRRMMDFNAIKLGLDNKTTSRDLGILLELIYKSKILTPALCEKFIDILKRQQNHGSLDLYLPEGTILANKLGNLDGLEHDAGIIYSDKGDYILCVLTNNCSSNKEGTELIGRISKLVFDTANS